MKNNVVEKTGVYERNNSKLETKKSGVYKNFISGVIIL
jgi:hypothetical protein